MDHLAAPQSSNEIWLEINHRGVRAHVAPGLGSGAYTYPVACVFVRAGSPHPLIAIRARDAHARTAKQRRTAARSARTRYYESRGPSSGENNGQPFRDNDELALHLACVYVYHAASPLCPPPAGHCLSPPRSSSFSLSFSFVSALRYAASFGLIGVSAQPGCFVSTVRRKWSVCAPPLHGSYAASRCGEINLYYVSGYVKRIFRIYFLYVLVYLAVWATES